MRQLVFLCLFVFFARNWCSAFEPVKCYSNGYCYCFKSDTAYIPIVINGVSYVKYYDSVQNKDSMTCACGLAEVDGQNVRCTGNGNFEPVQCEADTCHCVDPQTGNALGSYSDDVANLEEMTCKCALAEFQEPETSETCTANGNFDDVKCDATQCHCADHNGEIIKDAAGNPKYSDDVSNQHNMNCDCALAEWTNTNPYKTYYCTPNGNHDTIVCKDGACFCYDPEGNPFTYFNETDQQKYYSYWVPEENKESLDCRCALGKWYHVDSGAEAKLYEEECDKKGGFRAMQCHNGTCFCVDEEGKTIAGEDGKPLYTMDQADFDPLVSYQQPQCKCARQNSAKGASEKCTQYGDKVLACNDYTSGNSMCWCVRPDDPARRQIGYNNTVMYYTYGPTEERDFGMDCECAGAKYLEAGEPETFSRDPACQTNGNWPTTGTTTNTGT